MPSSAGQSGLSARKTQWWCVLALFVGAAVLELSGALTLLAPYMAAVAAVWTGILSATHPWVVRRIPNVRGAIVLTGVVIAVGLTLYAVNTGHFHGHAQAMEHTVSPP